MKLWPHHSEASLGRAQVEGLMIGSSEGPHSPVCGRYTSGFSLLGHNNVCLYLFDRNRETEILKGQIGFLNDAINREEERAKELEMKSK